MLAVLMVLVSGGRIRRGWIVVMLAVKVLMLLLVSRCRCRCYGMVGNLVL